MNSVREVSVKKLDPNRCKVIKNILIYQIGYLAIKSLSLAIINSVNL